MQPQFKIESYEIANNEIIVMLEKYNAGIPVTIPQDKFEWWLRVENKLDWELNASDHQGQHQQFFGTMSLAEYWDGDKHYIHNDLYEYITSHPIKKDGVTFSNSLENILLHFDMFNAKRITPHRWEHDQEIFNELIN